MFNSSMNRKKRTVSLIVFILFIFAAIYAYGFLSGNSGVSAEFSSAAKAPSFEHLFGTDHFGRDLLARTVKGLSVSLTVGIVASLISAVMAVLIGASAAIGSKRLDSFVTWLIDLVMSVPHIVLIILISFACGRGIVGLTVGIAATHWTSLARLIRAEVLQLRSQHYIAVSKKLGKSRGWILKNHILPHIVPQFIIGLVLMFPHAILHEAAVSFLGFGLPPEAASVGIILSESMNYLLAGLWWPAVFPGLTLILIVLLFDRLGDRLKDAFDPKNAQE